VTAEGLDAEEVVEKSPKAANGSDRVLAILHVLGEFPNGVGLNELSRSLNSPKSSVHRALGTLRRSELVEQDDVGRYRLGYGFLKLAFSYYAELDEVARVRPVLATLATQFGETTHYAKLDQFEVVYLAKVQPATSWYEMTTVVGGRKPAYCTGVGKALLAYVLTTREAVEEFVRCRAPLMVKNTEHTLVTPNELHEEFERIRDSGYAVDREEREMGINCLAIPLFLTSKKYPDGALSITAVSQRLPLSKLEASFGQIRDVVRQSLGPVLHESTSRS
jgi:IclR family transcriptional regulator, acetate operon repressor